MNISGLSGETYDHKVAAVFENEAGAKRAATVVSLSTSLHDSQIFVVGPNDKHPGWELEPEDKGIWRTLLRSHAWLAIVGAIVGIGFFLILFVLNIPFVTQNALTSLALAFGFGAVIGMMFAGLITLRPDHMPYISTATTALQEGKYVVAVHATSAEQMREASNVLDRLNVKSTSSL